jgi:hypothetical protein
MEEETKFERWQRLAHDRYINSRKSKKPYNPQKNKPWSEPSEIQKPTNPAEKDIYVKQQGHERYMKNRTCIKPYRPRKNKPWSKTVVEDDE